MEKRSFVGKRLSFTELLEECHVQVPIIQRDYAQGRKRELEVRNSFLDKLFDYMVDEQLDRDLDFVYGNKIIEDGVSKFIPLDGQQRLTTLMLLHWYLAVRSRRFEHFDALANHKNEDDGYVISKFSYETRNSSRNFCNMLFRTDLDLNALLPSDNGKTNSLSNTIRNEHWFSLSWITDPTVKAMLNMLDAIHGRFFHGSEGFYERLTDQQQRVITFLFLDLDEHNLSDDLYIKMNARGVTLTSFENFKANFEQYLTPMQLGDGKYYLDFFGEKKEVSLKSYYAHQLDTTWSNIFWTFSKHQPSSYDVYWTNFIRTMAISVYSGMETNLSSKQQEKILEDLLAKSGAISFYGYNKIGLFNNIVEGVNHQVDKQLVGEMICFLDVLYTKPDPESYFAKGFYYDENRILRSLLSTNYKFADYGNRVKFYAYYKYLIKWAKEGCFDDFNGLSEWLRVVHNLVEGTLPYDGVSGFLSSIRAIDILLAGSNNILSHVQNFADNLSGFDEYQWREERIKAKLIIMDEEWRSLILQAEQHEYFNGQIGFLLFLTGINESGILEDVTQVNHELNERLKIAFSSSFRKAEKVFVKGGIKDTLSVKGKYIWERALLCFGNYSLQEGQNQSLLIGSDRDISWKRFFKLDKPEAASRKHAEILKAVFALLDADDIEGTLLHIITSREKRLDWKNRFIENPSLFSYLGNKRYFRRDTGHGFVLFKGERMSGGHAELCSYDLFTRVFNGMEIGPFTNRSYYYAGGDDSADRPCAYFDKWLYEEVHFALDVFGEPAGVLLRFFYRGDGYFPEEVDQAILQLGFVLREGSYLLTLHEDEVKGKLMDVFEALNSLVIKNVTKIDIR